LLNLVGVYIIPGMALTNTEILGRKSVPVSLFTTKGQCGFKVVIIAAGVIVIVVVTQMAVATVAA